MPNCFPGTEQMVIQAAATRLVDASFEICPAAHWHTFYQFLSGVLVDKGMARRHANSIVLPHSSSFFFILLHSCILCASQRFWIPLDVKWQSGKWCWNHMGSHPHGQEASPTRCAQIWVQNRRSSAKLKVLDCGSDEVWPNCDQILQHPPHDATRATEAAPFAHLWLGAVHLTPPKQMEGLCSRSTQSTHSLHVNIAYNCIILYNCTVHGWNDVT